MQTYEIQALFDYSYYKEQEKWEQTRLLSYILCKVNGAKNIKELKDIIKFQWDEKQLTKEEKQESIKTDIENFERLRKKAQKMIENNLIG